MHLWLVLKSFLWSEGNKCDKGNESDSHTHTQVEVMSGNRRKKEPRPPQLLISVRNSSRVFGSSLKTPNMVLVTVLLFIFWTPRITMHMWLRRRAEVRREETDQVVNGRILGSRQEVVKKKSEENRKGSEGRETKTWWKERKNKDGEDEGGRGGRKWRSKDGRTYCTYVASMTTPTPVGCRASVIATAICLVNLSWTAEQTWSALDHRASGKKKTSRARGWNKTSPRYLVGGGCRSQRSWGRESRKRRLVASETRRELKNQEGSSASVLFTALVLCLEVKLYKTK